MANLSSSLWTPSILQTNTKVSLTAGYAGSEKKDVGKSSLLKSKLDVKPLGSNASSSGKPSVAKDLKAGNNLSVQSSTKMGTLSMSSSVLTSSLLQTKGFTSSILEKNENMKSQPKSATEDNRKSGKTNNMQQMKSAGNLLGDPLRLMTLELKTSAGLKLTSSSKLLTSSFLKKPTREPLMSPAYLSMTSSSFLTSSSIGIKSDAAKNQTHATLISTSGGAGFQNLLRPSGTSPQVQMTWKTALSIKDATVKKSGEKSAKKKVQRAPGLAEAEVSWVSDMETPQYQFEHVYVEGREIPAFLSPEQEESFLRLQIPVHDVESMKNCLINAVSASLIRAPDFKQERDPVRIDLLQLVDKLSLYDGEFVLKLALYTRNELNIRTTGNFLLACASNLKDCRPFLRKYYNKCIRLPSDWIDVAEQYQVFHKHSGTNFGSLPAALRRVMKLKFPDFDKYQLAKYNKENSIKKKRKKEKKQQQQQLSGETGGAWGRGRGRGGGPRGRGSGRGRGRGGSYQQSVEEAPKQSDSESSSSDSDNEEEDNKIKRMVSEVSEQSETEEEIARLSFTLKQLIRKIHVTEPVEHVMSLIGKRYPATSDEFYISRLPGTWEPDRAGKRMKLPTPETWETQVSLKGNKATTWEDLLDHKKLPFMAMLRNLRNMIKAGVSEKHHQMVLKKLTDEGAVINSRQFPFRFFSAYEVLRQLGNDYESNQKEIIDKAIEISPQVTTRGRGRGGRGRGRGQRGRGGGRTNALPQEVKYDQALLNRYRKALDQAVKIATLHNVKPIRGNTVIFVNLGYGMNVPCTSARGLGAPRTVKDVGVLLGLMCKYSCEESKMVVYGNLTNVEVELEKGTILNNMESVLELQSVVNNFSEDSNDVTVPKSHLTELLRDRVQVDNVIILSNGMQMTSPEGVMVTDFLTKYRRTANPNLLFVSVDLSGSSAKVDTQIQAGHSNDIYIAGFSDQILRYIAERGDNDQLIHVENIDVAHKLKGFTLRGLEATEKTESLLTRGPERLLPVVSPTPKWRTARVFISSTFRDMHGERDLLTRFVFPELRARAEKLFVNVFEVDLRWGVTEETARSNKTLEVCLSEVSKCQYFLGLLGERYGWVPDKYTVPDSEEFDWVREYPAGASITELEMYSAALSDPTSSQSKAFFYFRDLSFIENVKKTWIQDFKAEDDNAVERMNALKSRICSSGLEVYKNYSCQWGGVLDNKPMVTGLEGLGTRVLSNLWTAVQSHYQGQDDYVDEWTLMTQQHEGFRESQHSVFVGRKNLIKQFHQAVGEMGGTGGLLAVVGKPGSGKTALMASFITGYVVSKPNLGLMTMTHFIGSAVGSTNIVATLRRLNQELCSRFALDHMVAEEYKNLVGQFEELLQEVSKDVGKSGKGGAPLVLLIDGLDLLEDVHQAQNLQWLPQSLPENVILIVSVQDGGQCHKALNHFKHKKVTVGTLDILDKAEVIRTTLAQHRKKLDESAFNNQMKLLTAKKDAANPFYLKVACEELRVYGLFEKIGGKLKSLPHTIPQLLQEVLVRLEDDHGEDLVSNALRLLACSRQGLHKGDLHRVLAYVLNGWSSPNPDEYKNMPLDPDQLLPQALYAQLLRALQGFLRPLTGEQSEMLSLSHKDVTAAVYKRYMTSVEVEKDTHKQLAAYYTLCADPGKSGQEAWTGNHDLAFSELPYHLACGGFYSHLKSVLCDLCFLRKKCLLGLTRGLIEDFLAQGLKDRVSVIEREKMLKLPEIETFKTFISSNLHILLTHPSLLWQQALNEPAGSLVEVAVKSLIQREEQVCQNIMEVLNKSAGANPCVYTVSNMPSLVTCLAVSRDCHTLAAGSKDCMVHVYDLDTGKEILTLIGHSDQVTSVCFVGSGKLCSASGDTTLGLWDLSTGHRLSVLKGHSRQVGSCSANKKGDVIVSGGWDRQLKVWNAKSGKLDYDLKGDHSPMNCVAWHPDDALIAVGSWDSTIRIWDVYNKLRKGILRGHMTSIRDVAYSPSGTHIASASLDGEVRLWASNNGSQVGTLSGHALPINRLTYSPGGHELITVSDDHKVKVWSGHLGEEVNQMGQEEDGAVVSLSLHPNVNVNTVAVGYHQGYVRVYDIPSGLLEYEVTHHKASVRALVYEKTDDHRLFTGSDDCTMKMLDSNTGEILVNFAGHTKPVLSITVGTSYIVSTSEDVTTCVYKLPYTFRPDTVIQPKHILLGHTGPVTSSAFNRDETMLVTASRDRNIMVWKTDNLKTAFKEIVGAHMDWINGISWSDTNDLFVTCSNDFCLKVWDTKTFTEKLKLTGHMSAVNSVAYSCGCIVSCACDGEVKVWTHKGTEITSLKDHKQRVNACDIFVQYKQKDISADIQKSTDWAAMADEDEWVEKHQKVKMNKQIKVEDVVVASCSDDGTVRLWRPLQGNEIASLTGHSDRVSCVAAAGSSKVCTASLDNTLKVWNPAPVSKVKSHKGEVSAMASDNGSVLVTGSRDGSMKLWVKTGIRQYTTGVYTWRGHTCTVSGVCFVQKGPCGMIASCSEDGSVKTWRIVSSKHGHVVKHVKTISGDGCPLTGIHSVDLVKGHSLKVITTDWEENLKLWDVGKAKMVYQSNQAGQKSTNWILCSVVSDQNMLYYGSTDAHNSPVAVELIPLIQDKKLRVTPLQAIEYSGDADVHPNKRQANWLTAVDVQHGMVCIGDVNGQMTLQLEGQSQRQIVKIHCNAVTSIAIVSKFDLIFTSSKDGTIKVWKSSLKQVGQYFAPSPVTRLQVLQQTQKEVTLACGDILGDITFLVWNF